MIVTPDVLKDMLSTIALIALLSVAYGPVTQALGRTVAAQAGLGAIFGGVAILAMLDPLIVAPGVIVDLRVVPVILAGAFLGRPGAAVATLLTLLARVGIGGTGVVAGSAGVAAAALAGLAWASLVQRGPAPGRRNALTLAALSLVSLPTVLLLPPEVAWRTVTAAWPVVVPIQLAGVLVVGSLLERERRLASERRRLGLAAARDPLTGLLNRRGFEAETGRRPRGPRGAALLVLDLDHFKQVNDRHGHAAGDAVLRGLAGRLCGALRSTDVVARFGGEEVVVLLADIGEHDAREAAARLCEVVRAQPFSLPGGQPVAITASVGCAWTAGGAGIDALLVRADAALYDAKDAGRDCWRLDGEDRSSGWPVHVPRHALGQAVRA